MAIPDQELKAIAPNTAEYFKLSKEDLRRWQRLSLQDSILFKDEDKQKKIIEEFGPTLEELTEDKRQKEVTKKAYKDFQVTKQLEEQGMRGPLSKTKATARFFLPKYITNFLGADLSVIDLVDESSKRQAKKEQERIAKKFTENKPISFSEANILGKSLTKGYLRDQVSEDDFLLQFPTLSNRPVTKEDVARIQKANRKLVNVLLLADFNSITICPSSSCNKIKSHRPEIGGLSNFRDFSRSSKMPILSKYFSIRCSKDPPVSKILRVTAGNTSVGNNPL